MGFRIGAAMAFAGLLSAGAPALAKEAPAPKSVHDFTVKTIEEEDFDLRKLRGRVLLIVNVASR